MPTRTSGPSSTRHARSPARAVTHRRGPRDLPRRAVHPRLARRGRGERCDRAALGCGPGGSSAGRSMRSRSASRPDATARAAAVHPVPAATNEHVEERVGRTCFVMRLHRVREMTPDRPIDAPTRSAPVVLRRSAHPMHHLPVVDASPQSSAGSSATEPRTTSASGASSSGDARPDATPIARPASAARAITRSTGRSPTSLRATLTRPTARTPRGTSPGPASPGARRPHPRSPRADPIYPAPPACATSARDRRW